LGFGFYFGGGRLFMDQVLGPGRDGPFFFDLADYFLTEEDAFFGLGELLFFGFQDLELDEPQLDFSLGDPDGIPGPGFKPRFGALEKLLGSLRGDDDETVLAVDVA
jgi:hypothetical protein